MDDSVGDGVGDGGAAAREQQAREQDFVVQGLWTIVRAMTFAAGWFAGTVLVAVAGGFRWWQAVVVAAVAVWAAVGMRRMWWTAALLVVLGAAVGGALTDVAAPHAASWQVPALLLGVLGIEAVARARRRR